MPNVLDGLRSSVLGEMELIFFRLLLYFLPVVKVKIVISSSMSDRLSCHVAPKGSTSQITFLSLSGVLCGSLRHVLMICLGPLLIAFHFMNKSLFSTTNVLSVPL